MSCLRRFVSEKWSFSFWTSIPDKQTTNHGQAEDAHRDMIEIRLTDFGSMFVGDWYFQKTRYEHLSIVLPEDLSRLRLTQEHRRNPRCLSRQNNFPTTTHILRFDRCIGNRTWRPNLPPKGSLVFSGRSRTYKKRKRQMNKPPKTWTLPAQTRTIWWRIQVI